MELGGDPEERPHEPAPRQRPPACDVTCGATLIDGHATADAFESGRYRIEPTVVADRESVTRGGVEGRYPSAFTVLDREARETVRIGTSLSVRAFHPGAVLSAALEVGFAEATLVAPPPPHGGGLVAYREA